MAAAAASLQGTGALVLALPPDSAQAVRALQLTAAAFFAAPATERARFAAATGASHDATGYHQLGHKEVLNARRGASFALPHALAAAVPPAQSALDAAGRQLLAARLVRVVTQQRRQPVRLQPVQQRRRGLAARRVW